MALMIPKAKAGLPKGYATIAQQVRAVKAKFPSIALVPRPARYPDNTSSGHPADPEGPATTLGRSPCPFIADGLIPFAAHLTTVTPLAETVNLNHSLGFVV